LSFRECASGMKISRVSKPTGMAPSSVVAKDERYREILRSLRMTNTNQK
jgi:hypothetical protein